MGDQQLIGCPKLIKLILHYYLPARGVSAADSPNKITKFHVILIAFLKLKTKLNTNLVSLSTKIQSTLKFEKLSENGFL